MAKNKIIVIGGSTGSVKVLLDILPYLPKDFPIPIIIIIHRKETPQSNLANILQTACNLKLNEIEDKMIIEKGYVYLAPAGYHLLLEDASHFSLDCSEKINYSRPNINLSIESIINAYHNKVIGILLTGANEDGAKGMQRIKDAGGRVIVQSPESSIRSEMPEAAIKLMCPDKILSPKEIITFLLHIQNN